MHNRWYGVRIRAARNFFPSFSVCIHLKFMWISFNKWAMSYTDQFLFSSWKRNDGSENVEKVQKRSNHVVLIRFTCSSWQNQQEKGGKNKLESNGGVPATLPKRVKTEKKTHTFRLIFFWLWTKIVQLLHWFNEINKSRMKSAHTHKI